MDDKKLFKQTLIDLLMSNYDTKPTENDQYAEQLLNVHAQFVQRNSTLADLLKNYQEQREERVNTNNKLKNFIFWFFVTMLGFLTITVIIVFIKTDLNETDVSSVVALFSVVITYIGSLLAIFEIMSKYLFPADEEKDTISMIKTVIDNDLKVEELTSKSLKSNKSEEIDFLVQLKTLYDRHVITDTEFNKYKEWLLQKIIGDNAKS